MNFVNHLLFYMKLLNYLFCDMFGRQSCMSEQAVLPHWLCIIKSTHLGICSYSPIFNFLKVTFYHGMVTSVIFLIKNNLNRHFKHENRLSIYENMDYF